MKPCASCGRIYKGDVFIRPPQSRTVYHLACLHKLVESAAQNTRQPRQYFQPIEPQPIPVVAPPPIPLPIQSLSPPPHLPTPPHLPPPTRWAHNPHTYYSINDTSTPYNHEYQREREEAYTITEITNTSTTYNHEYQHESAEEYMIILIERSDGTQVRLQTPTRIIHYNRDTTIQAVSSRGITTVLSAAQQTRQAQLTESLWADHRPLQVIEPSPITSAIYPHNDYSINETTYTSSIYNPQCGWEERQLMFITIQKSDGTWMLLQAPTRIIYYNHDRTIQAVSSEGTTTVRSEG